MTKVWRLTEVHPDVIVDDNTSTRIENAIDPFMNLFTSEADALKAMNKARKDLTEEGYILDWDIAEDGLSMIGRLSDQEDTIYLTIKAIEIR
jgi:hypothetical protein